MSSNPDRYQRKIKLILLLSLTLNIFFSIAVIHHLKKSGGLKFLKMRLSGQIVRPGDHESNYYTMKLSSFYAMPSDTSQTVIFGNSIADYCDWAEIMENPLIVNRGIGGDNIIGMAKRVGQIAASSPGKVFIMLDSKDFNLKTPPDTITNSYNRIIDTLLLKTPGSEIFCTSILPVNVQIFNLEEIKEMNKKLEELAARKGINYIDLSDVICDENFDIKKQYTFNGVYLNGEGFKAIADVLNRYIKE